MKPLILLLLVFTISIGITKAFTRKINWRLSAIISMSAMMIFTALGHFLYTEGMGRMIPDVIPFKTEIVYATGLLEVILAVGLVFKRTRIIAAYSLIIFLLLILPANIHAAVHQVDFTDVSLKGQGSSYLWFRIPLQLFFIAWIYFAALFTGSKKEIIY